MAANISFTEKAKQFPPILVRLLARHPYGAPLTAQEISDRADNLSPGMVEMLSGQLSWDDVPYGYMLAFLNACGMDFDDAHWFDRVKSFLARNPSFKHLTRSPEWPYYRSIMLKWARSEPNTIEWPPIKQLRTRILSGAKKRHD